MENSNKISKREQLLDFVPDDTLLFADGFDDAIIGLETNSLRVVYSKQKMIQLLLDDMELDDAIEYLEFNTWSAYVGEQTPIYVDEIDVFESHKNM
jgi:hypothetical protein